jgi:hypothetical protein
MALLGGDSPKQSDLVLASLSYCKLLSLVRWLTSLERGSLVGDETLGIVGNGASA